MAPLHRPHDKEVVIGGRFRLEGEAAAATGGQAEVWRAVDLTDGRPAAVKFYNQSLSEGVFRSRLERELRYASRLRDKGASVVPILDHGEDETFSGVPFVAMEWMPGGSLRDLMAREGRLSEPRVADLVSQVAAVLDEIHSECVHRDVSPANLLVDGDGRVRVTDFGIARGEDDEDLTGMAPLGNDAYMAPERWMGIAVPASDLYSLAVIAFQMLTGRRPVSRPGGSGRGGRRRAAPSAHRLRADLSARVDAVFRRALAEDPDDRAGHYPTAGDFAADLVAALGGDEVTRQLPSDSAAQAAYRRYGRRSVRGRAAGAFEPYVAAAIAIAVDARYGIDRVRGRVDRELRLRPWLPRVLAGLLVLGGLMVASISMTQAVADWVGSLPSPVHRVAGTAALALALARLAGLPDTAEHRARATVLVVAAAVLLLELWSVALDDAGATSPFVAAAASGLAGTLAVLWRTGRREVVERIGLSALALAICASVTAIQLRFLTDWLWLWQDVDVDHMRLDELVAASAWVAVLTAVTTTVRQATRPQFQLRDIVTVPVWSTLLMSSGCVTAWALLREDLSGPLEPYLGPYLGVCGLVAVVVIPLTGLTLMAQSRVGSRPSGVLVWLSLAALGIAVFTFQVAASGPAQLLR